MPSMPPSAVTVRSVVAAFPQPPPGPAEIAPTGASGVVTVTATGRMRVSVSAPTSWTKYDAERRTGKKSARSIRSQYQYCAAPAAGVVRLAQTPS